MSEANEKGQFDCGSSPLLSGDRCVLLLRSMVRNAQWIDDTAPRTEPGPMCGPTWAKVGHLCGLGATMAIELCNAVGVDPHFDCAKAYCEHGVPEGEWCEPCNVEYKRARQQSCEIAG